MALALIKEKGPGGEFLSSQHTMERMRKLSNPKFFDRRDRKSIKSLPVLPGFQQESSLLLTTTANHQA
jgi:hypothetical protein